jgi:hypothetical protein
MTRYHVATPIVALLIAAGVMFSWGVTPAHAADDDAGKKAGAAEAYDRGTAAYLAGRYAEAGRWFETAYRLVPAYPSLAQALRAYIQVGDSRHVANLALRISELYAQQPGATELTEPLLKNANATYTRVDFVCTECNVNLDGKLVEHNSMFVEASKRYTFVFDFPTGQRSVEFVGVAGERRELRVEAPLPTVTNPEFMGVGADGKPLRASEHSSRGARVLPPWSIYAAAGVTVGLAAAALWSGLDAKAGVEAYEANPTAEALAEGQSKETRTNILIGAAAGAAVLTGVAAIFFTDWQSGSRETASPSTQNTTTANATPRLSMVRNATRINSTLGPALDPRALQVTPIVGAQHVGLSLTRRF